MLLEYLAENVGQPEDPGTIKKFVQMAHKYDPDLESRLSGYQAISKGIIKKMEALDPQSRDRVLNYADRNILQPVRDAVASKTPARGLSAIRQHGVALANALGVTIPKEHLAAIQGKPAQGMNR